VGPGRYHVRLKFATTRGWDTRANCFVLEGVLHCRYDEGHLTFDDCSLVPEAP
jgi:hypothetical protein